MLRNVFSQLLLIVAVLVICVGYMIYRYNVDYDVIPLTIVTEDGATISVSEEMDGTIFFRSEKSGESERINKTDISIDHLEEYVEMLGTGVNDELAESYASVTSTDSDATSEKAAEVKTKYRNHLLDLIKEDRKEKKFPISLGLDLKGGVHILLEALPPKDGSPLTSEKVQGAISVYENRLNPQGTREIYIQQQGDKWIIIEVPGERDPEKIETLLRGTAMLEFVDSKGEAWTPGEEAPEDAKIILTGDDLKDARADFDQYGRPSISFTFKSAAAEEFGKFTARNVGKYLAITLDGRVISCPTIQGAIFGGSGQITGDFSQDEVRDLAVKLNAGMLPVDTLIVENRAIGPTLGAESISKSLKAGLLGVCLVLVFMIIFYRLPGLVANVALIIYGIIMLGMMSITNATLTLPGIAGFILSIGMAVDANIIIFERLKEELSLGKTLRAALDAGFTRAFTAILDANVTTLIATAVLYMFGSGPIRGFAVTLSLGIVVSMFSALIVTRVFLSLAAKSPGLKSPALYGVSVQSGAASRQDA